MLAQSLSTLVLASLAGGALAQQPLFDKAHRMLPTDLDYHEAVAVGDLDGDGDLDALFGNAEDRLYRNDGNGAFTDVTGAQLPTNNDLTRAVALADVDGDGDLDGLFANDGDQNRLYLNDGSGRFTDASATHVPADADDTWAVTVGDVDGDGDLDVVFGTCAYNPSPNQNRLYLNDGTGRFTDFTQTRMPVHSDRTRAMGIGDLDGDGDLDLVMGNDGQNRIYVNNGSGRFNDVTVTQFPIDADDTYAVALGDVNGDGDLEVMLGNRGQNRLYLNNGTGRFADATATRLPPDSDITEAAVFCDVDSDGDLDAVMGNAVSRNRLYVNDGAGRFVDATALKMPADTDYSTAIALGDVDADGDPDALIANLFQSRLYLNDGAGRFVDTTSRTLPEEHDDTFALAVGDVDGDGDLDLMLGNGSNPPLSTGQNRLHLNDGIGGFTDGTALAMPLDTDSTEAVALGDVNGDGALDALIGNRGQNRLYLNNGVGQFVDVTGSRLPLISDTTYAVALGDVDGDGDLDAYIGNRRQDHLYRNDGTGYFNDVTSSHLPTDSDQALAVALGDVDGDGDLDAFLGIGGQNRLYLNNGAGRFSDSTSSRLPPDSASSAGVALGDVDGDGDLDAFIGNAWSTQNRLYLNTGRGLFADLTVTHLPVDTDHTQDVALGDFDRDGDLDALIGNGYEDEQNRVYLNDGTGRFRDATATLPRVLDLTVSVALGDVDLDGDLDAFIGNAQDTREPPQSQVYVNYSRQITWCGVPRLGKPLTMDVYGPPGALWLLYASPRLFSIPLPWGLVRIDLSLAMSAGLGVLDNRGRAAATFPVPANPSLVGYSLYWQGAMSSPPLITNLEITTVTAL